MGTTSIKSDFAAANSPVRSAIIPVGGMGTRMLPTTSALPKNMLTVGLKPLIQYAVEEALLAGCKHIHLVCSQADVETYRRHFFLRDEIAANISAPGKEMLKARVDEVAAYAPFLNFIVEDEPKGLGSAIAMAAEYVHGPFAVILPDDLILKGTTPSVLKNMADHYTNGISIAAMEVLPKDASKYGIFNFDENLPRSGTSMAATGIVEKPARGTAPSTMAALGRYILPRQMMDVLRKAQPSIGGEIQLTDAIDFSVRELHTPLNAVRFEGIRYDCGDPEGYLRAQNAVAQIMLEPENLAKLKAQSAPAHKLS
jgi:UTP--glucose-1-phosphate uridylyltransferase